MSSRLLTLMRKRGGFNPLSLNPTLLALPENSFSRTGGQFTAASSQYLSVASNSELQTGDVDFWIAGWLKASSPSSYAVVSKDGAGGREYTLDIVSLSGSTYRLRFYISGGSLGLLNADTFNINEWYHFFAWYSPSDEKIFLSVDGTIYSASATSGLTVGSSTFRIGGRETSGLVFDGQIDNVLFGKPPTPLGDGTSGSLAHTIATTLYNSGNGLAFQDITSAQETDWGIVSGWLDNSLTADAFGSNTLTNNNGVTQAAGKVNAVAVDNDPTFFVDDATPNDNDLTQVTLASRLSYDVDAFGSGKHGWLGTNAGHQHFPWSKVLPTKYSISVWLKPNFNYNSAGTTYNIWAPNTQQQFLRYEGRAIWGANDQFGVSLDGATYQLKVPFFAFSAGDLIHLAVTIDRDTDDYRIYKDGSLADTYNVAIPAPTATTTIYIGSWTTAGASWEGWIGPVLYTDDILTASEILALYNYGPQ